MIRLGEKSIRRRKIEESEEGEGESYIREKKEKQRAQLENERIIDWFGFYLHCYLILQYIPIF